MKEFRRANHETSFELFLFVGLRLLEKKNCQYWSAKQASEQASKQEEAKSKQETKSLSTNQLPTISSDSLREWEHTQRTISSVFTRNGGTCSTFNIHLVGSWSLIFLLSILYTQTRHTHTHTHTRH